jgi:uncharacterized RDD family membrane protein YckC
MSSSPSTPDDPGLFDDLPLHTEEPPERVVIPSKPPRVETPPTKSAEEKDVSAVRPSEELRMLFQEEPEEEASPLEPKLEPEKVESPPEKEPEIEDVDLSRARLVAGLADLGVVLAVAVSAFVCVALMGVALTPLPWAPMALFLTAFSFLYCVFPLAFWGRTPGMAWQGLRAKNLDGRSLSFGQTAWRWLAGLLTVVTFGLPLVLTLKGTYLSDLLSKSQVEIAGR